MSAVPTPPPIFVPSDVHENMSPSTRLPVRRNTFSQASASSGVKVPCSGAWARADTARKASMSGTLAM